MVHGSRVQEMKIERFEDIKAWQRAAKQCNVLQSSATCCKAVQLARELSGSGYRNSAFSHEPLNREPDSLSSYFKLTIGLLCTYTFC